MRKILTALFILASASTASALEINQDAPLFSLKDTNGQYFHLSDHIKQKGKGSKGIILNFFSSTCIPCKRELPVLNSLTDEFSKKGIRIVIVGYGEKFEKIEKFLNDLQVDKPIILSDVYNIAGKKYGVYGLPVTVFIGSDGKVKDIIKGELPEIEKILKNKANKLIKGK